ncbi:MAG: type III glutamate--ammonia ligase [Ideonella sp.]|nr:type III glutamate--ammonia ligase [Ideonella sp.]
MTESANLLPNAAEIASTQVRLEQQGVHTLLVQFTDVHGVAKGKYVPLSHLGELVRTGAGFAGPSIWGTALPRIGARAEYYARPIGLEAIRPMPWQPGYALATGNGYVDGQPFEACPRQVLRRATARLAERGWTLKTGIEPEFFLLKQQDDQWLPFDDADRLDKPSYDLKSLPRQAPLLYELHQALSAMGLDVFQLDHEDAHGQYEVNFTFDECLASADKLMCFKQAAHAVAERHGAVLSMMPKPFANQPGSGLHFHVSLWDAQGQGLFAPTEPQVQKGHHLSLLGRQFIAGVMAHSAALCALAAPTVNSYKRLVVGESLSGTTWAPAYVAHGPNNRTAVVRTLPGRFEWRLPDASANPYLATAALIAAGLDGIDRELDPGPACTDDLFNLSLSEIALRAIEVLPQSLDEAVSALEADPVILSALGDTLSHELPRLKRAEWLSYARHISAWELQRYAATF